MNYPNGDAYEGEWREDMREGFGVQRFIKGDAYEGEWLIDKMHGKGILLHADGSIYEGLWEHGQKKEGFGVFKYANGNVAVRSNYTLNDKYQPVMYSNVLQSHRFNMIGNGSQTTALPLTGPSGLSQQALLPQNTIASIHPPMVMRPRPLPMP